MEVQAASEHSVQPTVIKPTIGRRIWYFPSDYDRGVRAYPGDTTSVMQVYDQRQPCDAGIVYVHGDRMVNLSIVDHQGQQHARTSVTLVQPGDEPVPAGHAYATWMDYHVQSVKA